VWWCIPATPATCETEAGRFLKARSILILNKKRKRERNSEFSKIKKKRRNQA
jgi:hypothetical protein